MTLVGFVGNRKLVNNYLLANHAKVTPSLIIDCANCADPHKLFPTIPLEKMHEIYVFEVELLYKFRDVLIKTQKLLLEKNFQTVLVTTSDHLFNYQDELENYYVIEHGWDLMKQISIKVPVYVALTNNSIHHKFAKKHCDNIWDIH